jgi:hypothetical protein
MPPSVIGRWILCQFGSDGSALGVCFIFRSYTWVTYSIMLRDAFFLSDPQSFYLTDTSAPGLTRSASRTMSQFASRMHPWLAARPMVSGSSVP